MHYSEWGFSEPPFVQTALPADAIGDRLLIGREKQVKKIERLILSPPKNVTIEGPNGVGKTSLVNVAAYRAFMRAGENADNPLIIPCSEAFQLNADQDVEAFIDRVYYAIAQTLIKHAEEFKASGREVPGNGAVNRWLNSPQLLSYSAGLWVVQGGKSAETNTGEGFSRSGFRVEVRRWLESIFPASADGGVVCTIDNLELLQESAKARQVLETLRDPLLGLKGTRWVLCGALGIVLGIAMSPRFDGLLHKPIEVGGLEVGAIPNVLASRVDAFRYSEDEPYLPVASDDFERLHGILGSNLRSLLGKVDDYCQWCTDEDRSPETNPEKSAEFASWLDGEASDALAAAKSQVTGRTWKLFDEAMVRSGRFSPSEAEQFGFNSPQAMRPHVKALEDAGLLYSSRDDGDKRRKTINATAKGWIVRYARTSPNLRLHA